MILVDSSIWVDHLRAVDETLQRLLENDEVLSHPLIVGDVMVGNVRNWGNVRETMESLPSVEMADHSVVLDFIKDHSLFGKGIGYIDFHLLVSTRISPHTRIWTRDKRLEEVARRLNLASNHLPGIQ